MQSVPDDFCPHWYFTPEDKKLFIIICEIASHVDETFYQFERVEVEKFFHT